MADSSTGWVTIRDALKGQIASLFMAHETRVYGLLLKKLIAQGNEVNIWCNNCILNDIIIRKKF